MTTRKDGEIRSTNLASQVVVTAPLDDTAVPPLERELAAAMHSALALGSFVVLPLFWSAALLRLLPGAPARPFLSQHLRQATALHLGFLLVSIATCGVGFVLLALPVYGATRRAQAAARSGEQCDLLGRAAPR